MNASDEGSRRSDGRSLGCRTLQSERRRQNILNASREVLSQGFADFSLRKVAAVADVHLNTVQHHFKDLDSLIYATLDGVRRELLTRFARSGSCAHDDPVDDLLVFLDEAWIEVRKSEIRKFYFELWALALRRPAIEEMVRRMYGEFQAALVTIIRRVNPALTDSETIVLAGLMCSWVDGALVMAHWEGEGTPSLSLSSIRMKSGCLALLGVVDRARPV